jgi:hypothetical protein
MSQTKPRWVQDERRREKQRKVDVALLSGYFYPRAPLEKFLPLSECLAWVNPNPRIVTRL